MNSTAKTALVTSILVMLGAGCPRTAPVAELPTAPQAPAAQPAVPETPPAAPVAYAGNVFDPLIIKPGDTVAGLKVVTVTSLGNENPPEAENYRVSFEGNVTLSGTYEYLTTDFGGDEVSFMPDAAELAKLPLTKQRLAYPEVFLAGDLDETLGILHLKRGGYGKAAATITIKDYVVVWAPAEVIDNAILIDAEPIRPVAAPKPVSLEPYYVAYTAEGASKALAQGRATVLYFWAAWCPICRADEPKIKARIEGSDLPIAGFRVNYDVESDLKTKYKIPYQHTAVFLDKTGAEVERLSGPVDDATFLAAMKKATE